MSEPPIPLLTVDLRYEHDIVLARQRARELAAAFGCDGQDQIRLATAVSEIARNAFQYGGGGTVQFHIGHQRPGDAGVLVMLEPLVDIWMSAAETISDCGVEVEPL